MPQSNAICLHQKSDRFVTTFSQVTQWWMQDFPEEGAPTPKVGTPTYHLAKNFPKTAWKWKNLDPGSASLAPPLDPPMVFLCFNYFVHSVVFPQPNALKFHPDEKYSKSHPPRGTRYCTRRKLWCLEGSLHPLMFDCKLHHHYQGSDFHRLLQHNT